MYRDIADLRRSILVAALSPFIPLVGASHASDVSSESQVSGARASGAPDAVETITITGTYQVLDAVTATKTDTPALLTPVSIQTVSQQLIRDQQAVRLDRVMENVSGVFSGRTGAGDASTFIIRGFATPNLYRDGVRLPWDAGTGSPFRELANVESVEVLKGPAAILYGRIEPGGMINLITKQPQQTPQVSLQQQGGSHEYWRTSIDAGGPLNDVVGVRVNAVYETRGGERTQIDGHRTYIAPTVRWDIDADTQITLELERLDSRDGYDGGIPVLGDRPAPVSAKDNLGELQNPFDTKEKRAGLSWSHAFNDDWSFHQRFDWMQQNISYQGVIFAMGIEDPDTCTRSGCPVTRAYFGNYGPGTQETDGRFVDQYLVGRFDTGAIAHTLLIGGDYYRSECCADGSVGAFIFTEDGVPPIDLFSPVHTGFPDALLTAVAEQGAAEIQAQLDDPSRAYKDGYVSRWWGAYLQDQIELPHAVYLLVGARYDEARDKDEKFGVTSSDDSEVSPRFGVLWQPMQNLSLYGHYVRNFGASNGRSVDGGFVPPQKATEYELGLKSEWLQRRVVATVAAYELTKENVTIADPDPALAVQGYVRAIGEARSRGLEFDVTAELLDGWKLIAAYSLTDTEITKDRGVDESGDVPIVTDGNTGNRFFAVPRNGGSLWTTYEHSLADDQRLTVGGGVTARSQTEGDAANTFQVPGYALTSLMGRYELRIGKTLVAAQVNVDNLFDRYYVSQDPYYGGLTVGASRSVLASLRVEY